MLAHFIRIQELLFLAVHKACTPDNQTYSLLTFILVEALFELMKGLIKDLDETYEEVDEDDFKEQNSVARPIQMLSDEDPNEMFKIITVVKNHALTGGPKRICFV
ncbi:Vacuolar protein sorting-associated protein 35B [Turnera subulata]|uniref:Vacuolar protein sorting-associated protein 35B n=1 Tax=Turnera subulata TaxID=218843 RepID=A0A9Q0F7U9_9ROSI|nr:Vacuolar protein sorting-associated protein 35B [Turnera subulata]